MKLTILHLADLDKGSVECVFRKWYTERDVFDEETAKAPKGRITFQDVTTKSTMTSSAIKIALARSRLQTETQKDDLIRPLEGLEDVEFEEVFVDPILSDKSAFDRSQADQKTFSLDELLRGAKNLLIAGRSEFGKTTILRHAREFFISNEKLFETKVPVILGFNSLPKSNIDRIIRLIAYNLGETNETAESFASLGQLIILIDDFNDRQDLDHTKRVETLKAFFSKYSKCRYILSATEYLSQPLQFELMNLSTAFDAQIYYIGSLNTARIRQLLQKWHAKQEFDLDGMLQQILYYFQHFQIPVTPLAVILFLGVLFRRKKERNIRNEAYLIENYLETLLEKLNPSAREAELDFRDKEDFLATVACEMVKRGTQTLEEREFEKIKFAHFERQDEDLPHHTFFDSFFKKGILVRDEGRIAFRRRFWRSFFIAKAMELDKKVEQELLARPDILKFSKALTYKAGLSRDDVSLLKWVDGRIMAEFQQIIDKSESLELQSAGDPAALDIISKEIANEIREKNKDEEVDIRHDSTFLCYEEDKGHLDEQQIEAFDDLLALHSDIIRNTTKIPVADKRRFIENNVSCYKAIMFVGLEVFKDLLLHTDEEKLFKLFFKGRKDATMEQKLRYVIEQAKRIVHQVVPLSVMVYMNEHLGNPKLIRSFRSLGESTTSRTKRHFYNLLVFAQKPKEGLRELKKLVTPESSTTEDFLIYGFVRTYCHENKLDDETLDKIVALLDTIRLKYAKRVKGEEAKRFMIDTFRPDTKKELKAKHVI